ncbi:hypothetical protein [Streptomyces sp. CB02261]|uniref:hypothetical protein n=1 Tax=Streptomyces sp. CB02261 TaxID=1703940 RepID=UPI00116144AB|nr:hypothetical protein [Streptomyces sp. CB02261]
MSTARRRTLGPGRTDLPEPAARDPRAMTAAERAATGDWTAEPAASAPLASRPARRRLVGGPADPGSTLPPGGGWGPRRPVPRRRARVRPGAQCLGAVPPGRPTLSRASVRP